MWILLPLLHVRLCFCQPEHSYGTAYAPPIMLWTLASTKLVPIAPHLCHLHGSGVM